ncbi:MAG: threonylcarbamoyl-AMP synthase [Chitinispirillales bacterium]|jgi:tRNA threonylcarbamoyl adenosine modification protein (Sua5/YciO/YrdC/YwlC family)|nr:threonylcarbamoyl-AMP synthase [Chitinispirillales bacterium]
MFQRINVHPQNPQERQIAKAVEIIKKTGGICIYPTDTVYGVGCAASNIKKIKEIAQILHKDVNRRFSFVCNGLSQAEQYAKIENSSFKIMKRYIPGPYTFVLPSSQFVQKKISEKRKTIGIRITGFLTTRILIEMLGEPLANMSLNTDEENHGNPDLYLTPEVTSGVDVILDAGVLEGGDSTVVDLTNGTPVVLRRGKGEFYE